jgi:hypothetical protein
MRTAHQSRPNASTAPQPPSDSNLDTDSIHGVSTSDLMRMTGGTGRAHPRSWVPHKIPHRPDLFSHAFRGARTRVPTSGGARSAAAVDTPDSQVPSARGDGTRRTRTVRKKQQHRVRRCPDGLAVPRSILA